MLVRTARITVLIAWVLVLGVVAYLATHARVSAPFLSRLVSRHFLQQVDGRLRLGDYRLRPLHGVDLYGVTVTLRTGGGGLTVINVDTLEIDFKLPEVIGRAKRLRRLELIDASAYVLLGEQETERPPRDMSELSFPDVQADRILVTGAKLEVSGRDGLLREQISRLDWDGKVVAADSLWVLTRHGTVVWDTHQSRLDYLRGEIVVDGRSVRSPRLRGRLNDHPGLVSGARRWDGHIDLFAEVDSLTIEEISNLIDINIGVEAAGNAAGQIVVAEDGVHLDLGFTGVLEGYNLTGATVHGIVTPTQVRLDHVAGEINGTRFDGAAWFEIADPSALVFDLEGQVEGIDVSRDLVPGEVELPVTGGRGYVTVHREDRGDLTRVTGEMQDGFIDVIPFDTCSLAVTVDTTGLSFERFDLTYGSLQANMVGSADTSDYFIGDVQLEVADLDDLPPRWGWPRLGGRMIGQGTVRGHHTDLDLTGWARLEDLRLDLLEADEAVATVVIEDVLGEQVVNAGVDGEGFRVGGVPVGRFVLWGAASASSAQVDSFRSELGDTIITFRGHATLADTSQYYYIEAFGVDLEGNAWRIDKPVQFWTGPGQVTVPELTLLSEHGSLQVDAHYTPDVVAGSLLLRSFDLGLVTPFLPNLDRLTGEVTADVLVAGRPEAPVISVTATAVGSEFALATIDTLEIAGSFSRATADIDRLHLVTNYGTVEASGEVAHPGAGLHDFWPGAAIEVTAAVSDGDWAFVDQFGIPALDRIAGRFAGELKVGGTTDAPVIEGDLTSAPFHIHWLHLDRLDGQVTVTADQLTLAHMTGNKGALTATGHLEVPLFFDLLSVPAANENGFFTLQLSLPPGSDLGPLARATNGFYESSGRGQAEVVVSGPLYHPTYAGSVEFSDAGFVLRGQQEIYRQCAAAGTFAGDELRIAELNGEEGEKGTFQGTGYVLFDGLKLAGFELQLAADRFLIATIPDLRVLVRSHNTRMSSEIVGPDSVLVPKFSGDLEVIQARYTGDFSEAGEGIDPRQGNVAPDWLADVNLIAPPRSGRIVNRAMEIDLSGDVNLVRDVEGLFLRGTMNIDAGRLPVFNNDFKVVRGRLDFSQEVGLVPMIDLDAETRVRLRSRYGNTTITERITVHVSGTIYKPEISYLSESGYSRSGIERMLLGMSPYASDDDAERLRNTSISAGFNLVEREIAQELNIVDTFEIDQIDRVGAESGSGFDPLIGVGKYLGQDLYVKYAQGLDPNDRDILIEYQVGHNVLLQSEIRRRLDEYQGEDSYNFDLKYRVEY